MSRRRVLYLYNEPEWAIHNVGRDWAALLEETHEFELVRFGEHERLRPDGFDHVLFGYSTLDYSPRMLLSALMRDPFGVARWRGADRARLRAVVHDPCELFPEVARWAEQSARADHLARFGRLAVTSNEMVRVLKGLGRETTKVNTRSLLPLRDERTLGADRLRVFTRAADVPRKNLALFRALQAAHGGACERFDAHVGTATVTPDEYAARIDGYNCYVCTSWQEGGPLPLMDALRRGCVVLTTRVGQTDELVSDGENGFFCDGEAQFAARLRQLAGDPSLLLDMRRRALARAAAPTGERVRAQLREFLP